MQHMAAPSRCEIQEVDAVAAARRRRARRVEVGEPEPIAAQEEHLVVADAVHLEPRRRRAAQFHPVERSSSSKETITEEELARGLD